MNEITIVSKDNQIRIEQEFKTEINIGLTLPFEYSKRLYNDPSVKKESTATWYDINNNLICSKITVYGHMGPAGSLEQDVLQVFMSLCVDRGIKTKDGKIRIYYKIEEIRRALGLKKGSHKNIRHAIDRLQTQDVIFNDLVVSSSESIKANIKTKIITSSGSFVRKEHHEDIDENICGNFFVELDSRIVKGLHNGLYSTIDRKKYLELSSGAPRRIYQILNTRRKLEGNTFIVKICEIASTLGLRDKRKWAYYIKKYLLEMQKKGHNFEFQIRKQDNQNWLYVSFNEKLIDVNIQDEYYMNLISWYGLDFLEGIGLTKTVYDLLKEVPKYMEEVSFANSVIPRLYLYIDMLLFQVDECGYKIKKSFTGLLRQCLENKEISFNDSYTQYVTERLVDKKKDAIKDVIKREARRKEIELEQKEIKRTKLVNNIIKNLEKNTKKKNKLLKEAEAQLSEADRNSEVSSIIKIRKLRGIILEKLENGEPV